MYIYDISNLRVNVTKEYLFVSYQDWNFLNVRANPIFVNRYSYHRSYLRTKHVQFVPFLGLEIYFDT